MHMFTKRLRKYWTHIIVQREKMPRQKTFLCWWVVCLLLLLVLVLPKGEVFMSILSHSFLFLFVFQNPLSFFPPLFSDSILFSFVLLKYTFFLYRHIQMYIYMQLEDYCEEFEKKNVWYSFLLLYDTEFNCKFLKQRYFISIILIILSITITWDH